MPFALASDDDPVIRLTNGHWPPYMAEEHDYQGALSRLISEAFAEAGYRVEFGFFPWSRGYQLARENVWDGAAAWSCLERRAEDFYFSDPLLPISYVFFHRQGPEFDWLSLSDIAGLRVAITQDYAYYQSLLPAIEAGTISAVISPTDYQNFLMLAKDRVDLFPMDALAGSVMLEQDLDSADVGDIRFHPRPLRTDYLHLLLSRRDPANRQRVEDFNEGLRALRESGRVRAIMSEMLGVQAAAVLERMEPVTPSACAPD